MSRRIFQNSTFLKNIYHATPFHRGLMIQFITNDQVLALSLIARKIFRRTVHISNSLKTKLEPYMRWVRLLSHSQLDMRRRKIILRTFPDMIPLLIRPILHLLDED